MVDYVVHTCKNLCIDSRLVHGAGAIEIELSLRLKLFADPDVCHGYGILAQDVRGKFGAGTSFIYPDYRVVCFCFQTYQRVPGRLGCYVFVIKALIAIFDYSMLLNIGKLTRGNHFWAGNCQWSYYF